MLRSLAVLAVVFSLSAHIFPAAAQINHFPYTPALPLPQGSYSCSNGGCSCISIGYPSSCCPSGSVCSHDASGTIACCAYRDNCQGTIGYGSAGSNPGGLRQSGGIPTSDQPSASEAPSLEVTTEVSGAIATVQVGSGGSASIYFDPNLSNTNINTNDNGAGRNAGSCEWASIIAVTHVVWFLRGM